MSATVGRPGSTSVPFGQHLTLPWLDELLPVSQKLLGSFCKVLVLGFLADIVDELTKTGFL